MTPSRSLRILLIDDDFLVLSQLATLVRELGHEVSGQCLSLVTATQQLEAQQPDLVICDIVFGRTPTGPAWARQLQHRAIPYLLVSGGEAPTLLQHLRPEETAVLLHKPVRKRDLFLQIEAVSQRPSEAPTSNTTTLEVSTQGKTWVLDQKDILYAESDKNDYIIHTPTRRYIGCGSLRELTNRLSPAHFAQLHRSYIVQLKAIRSYNARFVTLPDGHELPIGRKYRTDFLAILKASQLA